MSQLAKFAIVGDCSRCSGRYSTILRNSLPRAVFLAWALVLVGILSCISLPSVTEAADVCQLTLQGGEFDDEVDISGYNFEALARTYQLFCLSDRKAGTALQWSQSYKGQGFISLRDLPIFRDAETSPPRLAKLLEFLGPHEILFHRSFNFDDGVGTAVVITTSIDLRFSASGVIIGAVGSAEYTVWLEDRPSEAVRIELLEIPLFGPAVVRPEVSWSPTMLEFTPENWNMLKTVYVSSSNPFDSPVRDFEVLIGHYINENRLGSRVIVVSVQDDDSFVEPGVHLSMSELTIDEGGSETYTVTLESNPDGNVIVTPTSSNRDVVTVSPPNLTFTANDWSSPQLVTVSAAHDDDAMDDTATIAHAVSGYGTVTAELRVGHGGRR